MAIFYREGVVIIDTFYQGTNQNCFKCLFREGKYCDFTESELTLVAVEDNILKFAEQAGCVFYSERQQ